MNTLTIAFLGHRGLKALPTAVLTRLCCYALRVNQDCPGYSGGCVALLLCMRWVVQVMSLLVMFILYVMCEDTSSIGTYQTFVCH